MDAENEKTNEASVVVVIEKDLEAAGKDVVMNEADVGETSAGGDDDKVVETSMDDKQPEEAASQVPSAVLASSVEEEKKAEDETSVEGASPSGVENPKEGLPGKKKVVKRVKQVVKKKVLKGGGVTSTSVVAACEENAATAEDPSLGDKGTKKAAECSSGKELDSETSLGGEDDDMESTEELGESPADASALKSVGKRLLKGKKVQGAALKRTTLQEPDKGTGQENNNSLAVNEKSNGVEKPNSLEVNTSEQKNEDQTGMAAGGRRRKRRRGGKQTSGPNKKQMKEEVVASATATDAKQKSIEEGKKKPDDDLEKREVDGQGNVKHAGLIFMCNAKTRPDCFRFSVMGVQEKRKDYVMSIKPGIKLFLYDYDLKLLYGVFQASSAGGMKLERNAFGGSFPAQVRFKVVSDCIPLPESEFKKAIKENYNNRNKFKTELTRKQVFKLTKLFRPATLPAQLTHTLPAPVPRPAERKRSDNDRYAPGSSRTHGRSSRNAAAPPPRREEPPRREGPPRDLYLTESEYRTYGLRRAEPAQHYPVPPPESSYRLVDSYRPSVDHERLLRQAEIERHHERSREVLLPERSYHPSYDHPLSSRRLALEPPVESYRRDPYHRVEYRSPERLHRTTYLPSSGREDDDLYSRYVTPDSLAEYYRSSSSSRRYPSIAESEFPPSSITSRYTYSGSLPYSHR